MLEPISNPAPNPSPGRGVAAAADVLSLPPAERKAAIYQQLDAILAAHALAGAGAEPLETEDRIRQLVSAGNRQHVEEYFLRRQDASFPLHRVIQTDRETIALRLLELGPADLPEFERLYAVFAPFELYQQKVEAFRDAGPQGQECCLKLLGIILCNSEDRPEQMTDALRTICSLVKKDRKTWQAAAAGTVAAALESESEILARAVYSAITAPPLEFDDKVIKRIMRNEECAAAVVSDTPIPAEVLLKVVPELDESLRRVTAKVCLEALRLSDTLCASQLKTMLLVRPRTDNRLRKFLLRGQGASFLRATGNFLKSIAEAHREADRQEMLAFLSSHNHAVLDACGLNGHTAFERPLLLLERNGTNVIARHGRYEQIPRGLFLHIYGVLDGDAALLKKLNGFFSRFDSGIHDEALRRYLLQNIERRLIGCLYLPLQSHQQLLDALRGIDFEAPNAAQSLISVLKEHGHKKKVFYDLEAICRLQLADMRAKNDPRWPQRLDRYVRQLTAVAGSPDAPEVTALKKRLLQDPLRPVSRELDHSEREMAREELGKGREVSVCLERFGLPRSELLKLLARRPDLQEPLSAYGRALMEARQFQVLRFLAEILKHSDSSDTPSMECWKKWRYDLSNPQVCQQIGTLTAAQRALWIRDHLNIISLPGLESSLGIVITDDPLVMLSAGKYPIGCGACTDHHGPSYYSRSLPAYAGDAHIKGAFLFNYDSVRDKLAPLLRRDVPVCEIVARHGLEILQSSMARRILKLCSPPALPAQAVILQEPVFLRLDLQTGGNWADRFILSGVSALTHSMEALIADSAWREDFVTADIELSVPASRNPGGQCEKYDGFVWHPAQTKEYLLKARLLGDDGK